LWCGFDRWWCGSALWCYGVITSNAVVSVNGDVISNHKHGNRTIYENHSTIYQPYHHLLKLHDLHQNYMTIYQYDIAIYQNHSTVHEKWAQQY
jgi:hypothetical protein